MKPAGTHRIVVIGDCLTFGQGNPEDGRFTNRLQQALTRVDPRHEVLNLGRPATETVGELATVKDVLASAEPDFMLLEWFINDVEGEIRARGPNLSLASLLLR